jgi:hypothetical protein
MLTMIKAPRALMVLALLAPSLALAQQSLTERGRLERALSGIEIVPGKATLLRISPNAAELLREIVARPSRQVLARNRALAALRLFPSVATSRLLRGVIDANRAARNGLARLDLEQALASYATVAGPGSVEIVRPFLAHASLDVRHAAVGALTATGSPRAIGILEGRRRDEPSATVRARIDRELARLRAGSR